MTEQESYTELLYPLFNVQPKLTLKEAKAATGVSKAQFYRIKKQWLEEVESQQNEESHETRKKVSSKKKKKKKPKKTTVKVVSSRIKNPPVAKEIVSKRPKKLDRWALNPKKIRIWELSDRDLKDLFVKFVGFRGYYSKEINHIDGLGYAILDVSGEIHAGEAIPEPIDEITGEYWGIQDYQAEFILIYRDNFNILDIWGRGFGKTWVVKWIIQFSMKFEADKILYFSLTNVAYEVANDVYIWAQQHDAIVARDTVKTDPKKLTGRIASYQQFSLINGARFEVHGISTATTLGYHGWIIVFDDIIDEQHKRLPVKQKDLERKWNSQYSKIRRKKLLMVNTRKFAGDFFDFIINQFEKKGRTYEKKKGTINYKFLLHISLKTPYREIFYEGDIAGYRAFVDALEKNLIHYDEYNTIAPWYHPEEFRAMKLESIKSFYAEMMGVPRILGGGWIRRSDIRYRSYYQAEWYEAVAINVDPAFTITNDSDESGIVVKGLKFELIDNRRQFTVFKAFGLKVKHRTWYEEYDPRDPNLDLTFASIVVKDGKQMVEHLGLLEIINIQYKWAREQFPQARSFIVPIETNSGGIVIIDAARAEPDKYEFAGAIVEVTHVAGMDKKDRIDSENYDPIKNGDQEYMDYLADSKLIEQTINFPDSEYLDVLDADAMGTSELKKLKRIAKPDERRRMLIKEAEERRRIADEEQWEREMGKFPVRGGGYYESKKRRSMLG